MLGIAYKKNIEDTRESSGIKIFEYFRNNNFKIDYCDPYIKRHDFKIKKKNKIVQSINYSFTLFKKYDAFILCTDHDIFNFRKLIKLNKTIFDLRGRYHKISLDKKNIISF